MNIFKKYIYLKKYNIKLKQFSSYRWYANKVTWKFHHVDVPLTSQIILRLSQGEFH